MLVGSEDPDDVDPFVVEGFLATEKAASVEVHLTRGAPVCYKDVKKVRSIWHRYDDWDVTVLEVVRGNADGVIVIGGRKGVVQAGIAGWMLGKSIIPFGGFDGGASTVWGYGSSDRKRFYFDALSDAEIDQLNTPWTDDTAAMIVEYLDRCAAASQRAVVSPRLRFGTTVAVLVTLLVWVLLLALPLLGYPGMPPAPAVPAAAGTPTPLDPGDGLRLVMLLGSVCAAGAFGSLVQTMRGMREGRTTSAHAASTDAVLGIAAGFLTAALYMLAQIAITGKFEPPADNANYSRISLIVSMASVFASLYLDAAFSRFDGVKESVMSGHYGEKS